jgi:hypothetical protein
MSAIQPGMAIRGQRAPDVLSVGGQCRHCRRPIIDRTARASLCKSCNYRRRQLRQKVAANNRWFEAQR